MLNVLRRAPAPAAVLLLLSFSSVQGVAAATYYRWLDAAGNPVISDRPPTDPSITFETISSSGNLRSRTAPDPADQATSTTEASRPTAADAPRGQVNADAEQPGEADAADAALCTKARANLQTLDNAPRIRMQDESGEMRFLSEAERATQREAALRSIKAHCKQ